MTKHKSLEEYAREHPQQELAPEEEQLSGSYRDIYAARQRAADLKEILLQQLKDGEAPEVILFNMLEIIECLDTEPGAAAWMTDAKAALDRSYPQAEQLAGPVNARTAAVQKLEQVQQQERDKLQRYIKRAGEACQRIADALEAVAAEDKSLEAILDERTFEEEYLS